MSLRALTHWNTPFTGSGQGILPEGAVLVVAVDPPPGATALSCDPEDPARLEAEFVTAVDRNHPKYAGFSLVVPLDTLDRDFERLWLSP